MIVEYGWPNCNLKNGKRIKRLVDSFWVKGDSKEVKEKILPFSSQKEEQHIAKLVESLEAIQYQPNARDIWKDATEGYCNLHNKNLCFLISRDLESITLMPWFYPISQHWGDYSPFILLHNTDIKDLSELKSIIIPKK